MIQALVNTISVLAATTGHRRHGALIAVIVLVVIAGLAYYAWHQRKLRQRAEHERR
jgi:cytochrome bd-type quinol oxidase subunit 2